MPRSLALIPHDIPVTDKAGAITDFFRLRWQQLIDSFAQSPTVGSVSKTGQTAALASTIVFTTKVAGLYRVSYIMRKTVADGVSSSLTMTLGWTKGALMTDVGAALTTDTTTAHQDATSFMRADAATNLTCSIAYASNTPAKMTYECDVVAELIVL